MRDNLTHAIEDYLKAIYRLTRLQEGGPSHGRATTNQIAAEMDITPASVSGMIRKLADTDPPLLDYEKHRGVILTDAGEKVALEIIRHHRLIELFLHQMLGVPWEKVHQEADRLEHVISEDLEERIAEALGHPSHDPHGDPIPTPELEVPPASSHPLSELRPGDRARIQRVSDANPGLLIYLKNHGLIPGIDFEVTQFSPYDGNLTLIPLNSTNVKPQSITLGPRVTMQIFVDDIEPA